MLPFRFERFAEVIRSPVGAEVTPGLLRWAVAIRSLAVSSTISSCGLLEAGAFPVDASKRQPQRQHSHSQTP